MQMLLVKGFVWLTAEIILTLLELDNLADYGEFVFRVKDALMAHHERIEQVLSASELEPSAWVESQPQDLATV